MIEVTSRVHSDIVNVLSVVDKSSLLPVMSEIGTHPAPRRPTVPQPGSKYGNLKVDEHGSTTILITRKHLTNGHMRQCFHLNICELVVEYRASVR